MKRTIHIGSETKTEKQWLKEGRLIKADARGERLWTNGYCQISAVYYKIEETYQATKDEIRKRLRISKDYDGIKIYFVFIDKNTLVGREKQIPKRLNKENIMIEGNLIIFKFGDINQVKE